MQIRKKLFKGAVWNSVSQFGSQGLNFLITIILARLLKPSDFGTVAIAIFVVSLFGFASEFGLIASLIQKSPIDEVDCHTAFWGVLFFNALLYGVVFIASPVIAGFFQDSGLSQVMRILFLGFFFAPMNLVLAAIEMKEIRYHRIVSAEIAALVVSGAAAIILAVFGFGLWSLVAMEVLRNVVRGTVLLWNTGWRIRFIFSITRFKSLCGTGFSFTLKNILQYISENMDTFILGKLLGPAALGIYKLANRISAFPLTKLWKIFGEMLFPAFGLFRDDLMRLRMNFARVSLGVALVLTPALIAIFFGAYPLVLFTVGSKWSAVVPIIKVLTLYLILMSTFFADESIVMILGKVKVLNILQILVSTSTLVFGFLAVKRFGLMGMVWSFVVINVIFMLLVKFLVLGYLQMKALTYIRSLNLLFVLILLLAPFLWAYEKLNIQQPILYLIGEGILMTTICLLYFLRTGVIDLKNKKITIDHLIVV